MFGSFVRKASGMTRRARQFRAATARRRRLVFEPLEQRLALSAEFQVNPLPGGNESQAVNASSSNGMSVVAWVHEYSATDHDIYAQLYDAGGHQQGSVIPVDTSTKDSKQPAVAMDSKGDFVVVWTDFVNLDGGSVRARLYNSAGTPVTDAFDVANTPNTVEQPSVAMDAYGNFVVSYTYWYSQTDSDIYARRFTSNGTPIGDTIYVATTTDREYGSKIAMTPDGRFDIAYGLMHVVNVNDVYLNRYAADGTALGYYTIAATGDDHALGDVSMNNYGDAVVVYQMATNNPLSLNNSIEARRVSRFGVMGPEIHFLDNGYSDIQPTVAMCRIDDTYEIAFTEFNPGGGSYISVAQVSDADAITWEPNATPSDAGALPTGPVLSIDGNGYCMLTYVRDGNVFGQFNYLGDGIVAVWGVGGQFANGSAVQPLSGLGGGLSVPGDFGPLDFSPDGIPFGRPGPRGPLYLTVQ
jgi:hypothetical protein